MTSIIVLVLVGAWAGYLFLWLKDSRTAAPPRRDGITSFSRQLGSLGSTTARASRPSADLMARTTDLTRPPRSTGDAARRRREVMAGLACLAMVALVALPLFGRVALAAHVAIDVVFLAYGYAVVRRNHMAAEQEIKVRMLYPDRPQEVDPVVVPLRRTVNG